MAYFVFIPQNKQTSIKNQAPFVFSCYSSSGFKNRVFN